MSVKYDEQNKLLRQLAEAATPGPWYSVSPWTEGYRGGSLSDDPPKPGEEDFGGRGHAWTVSAKSDEHGWENDSGYPGYGLREANAAFIAAANPLVIIALLDDLARAREENERLREALEHIAGSEKTWEAHIARAALATTTEDKST